MKKRIMLLAEVGILSLGLLFGHTTTVLATENQTEETTEEATAEAADGQSLTIDEAGSGVPAGEQYKSVMQIAVTFQNEAGDVIPIQGGSGFLIGNGTEDAQYLLTSNEVVDVPEASKTALCASYGIESNDKINPDINVIVKRDVTISATIVTNSSEMNFAILKLSQPLYDREPFIINDKSMGMYLNTHVEALGFPTALAMGQDIVYYAGENIQKTEGFLEEESQVNGQNYVKHHIFPNRGNLGGPIINDDDEVLALNQSENDGKSFYALEMSEILPILDTLGVPYKTNSQIEAEIAEAEAAIVHKEALQYTIQKAQEIDITLYKKESAEALAAQLTASMAVNEDEAAEQKVVDDSSTALQTVIDSLELKTPIWYFIVPIVAGIIIIVIVILVILHKTRDKREAKKLKKIADFTVTEAAPDFSNDTNYETSYRQLIEKEYRANNGAVWEIGMNAGHEGETMAFSQMDESAETTVLNQSDLLQKAGRQKNRKLATLIRMKNQENIVIHKAVFVIGKDVNKADYCITDNKTISRQHAAIRQKNQAYVIVDMKATNGTYVNGIKILPEQEYPLKDGDNIRLSDEEFEFKM